MEHTAEVKEVFEALREFMSHHDFCEAKDGGPCGCGFAEAFSKYKEFQ